MTQGRSTVSGEWAKGWGLVLASLIGMSFYSVMLGSLGLFMEPLETSLGWSRTLMSSGPGIATTITAVLSPFISMIIDRFGTRRLVLVGLTTTIAVVACFGLLDGEAWQWLALWALYGTISASIKSTSWTTAVVGVFEHARGLALGLTYSGMAFSAILIPPLCNWLIAAFGWRAAYVWLATGWGGIALLLCVFLFFDVHARAVHSRKQDGTDPGGQATVDLPGLTIAQAWRSPALWRIAISVIVILALTNGLAIHLFPIVTAAGVPRAEAAWLVSLGGIAGMAGNLVGGYLLDRFRPNWVSGITMAAAGLAFLLLMEGIRSPVAIVIALIVNGFAAGTKIQIAGMLTAAYAGMRNFGTIYGVMGGLIALAGGIGPMMAGIVYDQSGHYGPFLAIGAVGCAICGLLLVTLPRAPVWPAGETVRSPASNARVGSTI